MGILYLVATPIGNLEDITYRAVRILGEVDVIFAEDTRHTAGLLNHLGMQKPLRSYHEHSTRKRHDMVLEELRQGKDVALCSDAGMPCIADPGQELVRDCLKEGITVVPVPGANAMLTGLIASGLSTDRFAFLGFYPRKTDDAFFQKLSTFPLTAVFYESPMRLTRTLGELSEHFPQRQCVVARELTKIHEEFVRGTVDQVRQSFDCRPVKGEIVLMLAGAVIQQKTYTDEELLVWLQQRLDQGNKRKEACAALASELGVSKNRLYRLGLEK